MSFYENCVNHTINQLNVIFLTHLLWVHYKTSFTCCIFGLCVGYVCF